MIGGSRSTSTLSTSHGDRQLSDDDVEPDDEPDPDELEPDELEEPELSDFVVDDELSLDDDPPSELDEPVLLVSLEVVDDAGVLADFLPRLSVLKKPEPLKVTPTGVKTFFTGSTSPLSGWAISVRFSSWKPCWTSMVSPVSTNL
jgi:hypothetical protein